MVAQRAVASAVAVAVTVVEEPVAAQLLAELSWWVPEPQLDWLVARARQAAQSLERKPAVRRASRDGPLMAEPSRDAAAPRAASAAEAREAPGTPGARTLPARDGTPRGVPQRPVRRHHRG